MRLNLFTIVMIQAFSYSRAFLNGRLCAKLARKAHFRLRSTSVEQPTVPKGFDPYPFAYHETLTLDIEEITNLGMGVARVNLDSTDEGSSKYVIFVPNVIPGEKVIARVYRNRKTYSEADLIEVLEPSPDRVPAQCAYFKECGGCQYQMMSVDAQRRWKHNQVDELMRKLGGFSDLTVAKTVGTDEHYFYRSKITPHYNSPRRPDQLRIGFQRRGSRNIVDIDRCIIATEEINQKYSDERTLIHAEIAAAERMPKKGKTLLFRHHEAGVSTNFRENVRQRVGDKVFEFRAGEFFQNNAYILPRMVEHVRDHAVGDGCRYLVDTYCGSGLFSICLSADFERVSGVEVSELAVHAARENAILNGVENVDFLCASSESIFDSGGAAGVGLSYNPRETCIIVDPPRKGCDQQFLDQLFAFSPRKVVYVSCDPATQARDAKIMVQEGGYRATSCTPFDLFPQTRHIENVMVFVKD